MFDRFELELIDRARVTAEKDWRLALADGELAQQEERALLVKMFEALHRKGLAQADMTRLCKICQRADGPCLFADSRRGKCAVYCSEYALSDKLRARVEARMKEGTP